MTWSALLEVHPIETSDGKMLRTLDDARRYVLALPETDATQAAAGELLKAAQHGGPFLMIARIMVAQAIYGETLPSIGVGKRPTEAERMKELRTTRRRGRKER